MGFPSRLAALTVRQSTAFATPTAQATVVVEQWPTGPLTAQLQVAAGDGEGEDDIVIAAPFTRRAVAAAVLGGPVEHQRSRLHGR
ncbi:hypothetical protein [Nocardia asiatica]|uniref:hypothetical protein n=1 Tax=Nocardia asiatica TaxID=209252 RepID=UPI00245608B2|nr:hypothetical protein [Nocardia asiatica]